MTIWMGESADIIHIVSGMGNQWYVHGHYDTGDTLNSIKGGSSATKPTSTRVNYSTQLPASPSNMASPQKRSIGGTEVFCLGYGCMGLSAYYGEPLSDEERFKVCCALCHCATVLATYYIVFMLIPKVLDAVYESGVTYWDSAYVYGDYEDLLGKW